MGDNLPKHVITIDFETYYDTNYSLTKMPTSAYVCSPSFEIIGVGFQLDYNEPVWVPNRLWSAALRAELERLPWDDAVCVAHNAQFDGLILEEHFYIHPARYFCTMMAARPVFQQKVGSTSLAKLAEHIGIGAKGAEVVTAKGKHMSDFSEQELKDYGEYCKNDVRLSYILYQLLMAWYEKRDRTILKELGESE